MNDNFKQIADRIRELREIYEVSLSDIARDTGVSEETYKSYETDGVNIPISVLYHLSHRFNVDLQEILTGTAPKLDDYCVIKKGHGQQVDRYPGYGFASLAPKFIHKMMEPLLVTVEPSETMPVLVTHPGQEFNMVLAGQIDVIINEKALRLCEGDCIYFNPNLPHGQRAIGGTATFLTVIAE